MFLVDLCSLSDHESSDLCTSFLLTLLLLIWLLLLVCVTVCVCVCVNMASCHMAALLLQQVVPAPAFVASADKSAPALTHLAAGEESSNSVINPLDPGLTSSACRLEHMPATIKYTHVNVDWEDGKMEVG